MTARSFARGRLLRRPVGRLTLAALALSAVQAIAQTELILEGQVLYTSALPILGGSSLQYNRFSKRYLLTWAEDELNGDRDIRGQLFDQNLESVSEVFEIASDPGVIESCPEVVTLKNGNFSVSYANLSGIFATPFLRKVTTQPSVGAAVAVDAGASGSSCAVPATFDDGASFQRDEQAPRVDQDIFVVGYGVYRSGNEDVHARYFDADLNPVTPPIPLAISNSRERIADLALRGAPELGDTVPFEADANLEVLSFVPQQEVATFTRLGRTCTKRGDAGSLPAVSAFTGRSFLNFSDRDFNRLDSARCLIERNRDADFYREIQADLFGNVLVGVGPAATRRGITINCFDAEGELIDCGGTGYDGGPLQDMTLDADRNRIAVLDTLNGALTANQFGYLTPTVARVASNAPTYTAGDRLQVDVFSDGTDRADFYVVVFLPDQSFYSLIGPNQLVTGIAPYQADRELMPRKDTVLSLGALPSGLPSGEYGVLAAYTYPGTLDPIHFNFTFFSIE